MYNKNVDIRRPTPEEMTEALAAAARAERWNHWEHEIDVHAHDWVEFGVMRKPLTPNQFCRLPLAVAEYQFVELCVYSYLRRVVWGYFCRRLPFAGYLLLQVLVVYDPVSDEIIHCMRMKKGKKYCDRWGRQEKFFVGVRW